MARRSRRSDLEIGLGSVLAIPIGDGRWSLGQVLHPGINFYIAISKATFIDPLEPDAVLTEPFGLFTWTNDAEVYNRSWKNLGVAALPQPMLALPEY